jgi:cytochrome c
MGAASLCEMPRADPCLQLQSPCVHRARQRAHGKSPALVGRNDTKDPKGKYGFAAQVLEIGKAAGKGWLEYNFENPVTHEVEAKVAYIERVDDLIVVCGAFKPRK